MPVATDTRVMLGAEFKFQPWSENQWTRFYQGEVSSDGFREGRGVLVRKGFYVILSQYKEDK